MDRNNTGRLLDETFSSDFDIGRFSKFVKELFNEIDLVQRDCTQFIAQEYKDYISNLIKLGEYEDQKKNTIEILVIKLRRTGSRDRARTMQRNFIANWLGKYDKDAALVAFYGDDEDWRFSFVKMEYNLIKDEGGKAKVSKEITPAKRYSFLVGINEPNHTCKRQFLELVMEDEINPSMVEIESAFSIDNVTKVFFNEYKELFLELNESLLKILEEKTHLRKEFEEKNISSVDFAKKLLGQIVFIYFLQKKGWLGVSKENDGKFKPWGSGPKKFLRKLYDKEIVGYDNFFNDVLEPLFYEALSTERDDDYYKHFNCKIPFLNGGLFEPINDYDWIGTEITLDNPIFDRILATFDRFNFTVKEDEPLEKEVAVDPEMLGKVFENLLEVKDRKSKGAFYTPREIVHYMCQQSLINYLETNSSIAREDIENFIQLGDFALAQIIKEQEQVKKYGKSYEVNEKFSIPKSIKENHLLIDKLLKEIKIVDPAVGSGAFPVGMMNEIVKARSVLSMFFKEERKNYDLKREIIENCLYGVDIEPSAVEITKLRFWLSLIVDELDMKNIKPLPNLDHKIMCGNSLLEEFEGVKLFDDRLLGEAKKDFSFEIKQVAEKIALLYKEKGDIARGKKNGLSVKDIEKEIKKLERKKEEINSKPKETERNLTLGEISEKKIKESRKKLAEHQKLQKEYFDAQNRKVKKQLREDIDGIEWELIEETLKEQGNEEAIRKLEQYKKNKAKPFFLWKLYFAEVFQRENPGFDVVIANPPYVGFHGVDSLIKKILSNNFISARGKFDLYLPFLEKGYSILRENGFSIFICPTNFTKREHGRELRQFLVNNVSLYELIDFEHDQIFDKATNYTGIFSFIKKKPVLNKFTYKLGFDKKKIVIDQSELSGNSWIFADKEFEPIIKKINSNLKLEEVARISEGIVTGLNELYLKTEQEIKENNFEKKFFFPCLRGKEIDKYYLGKCSRFIFYPYELLNDKTTLIDELVLTRQCSIYLNYLRNNIDLIKRRKYFTQSNKKWYELWNQRSLYLIKKAKILTPEISERNRFTISSSNSLYGDTVCGIVLTEEFTDRINLKYLLGLLNSQLIEWFYKRTTVPKAGGFFIYKVMFLSNLPIKIAITSEQNDIVRIVDQILVITKDDNYLKNPDKQTKVKKLEKEIDQLVYKLYELTPEEIKIVEEFDGK